MQIEVLQFLLEAQCRLRSQPVDRASADHEDLQGVERALPDCDWFEMAEFRSDIGSDALRWEPDMTDIEF